MDELERKTDCEDPKHRDVVYCVQCTDRDIAALEKKLSDALLQIDRLTKCNCPSPCNAQGCLIRDLQESRRLNRELKQILGDVADFLDKPEIFSGRHLVIPSKLASDVLKHSQKRVDPMPTVEDLLGECRECNRLMRDCGNHGRL